jgi:hypothetical protein
LEGFFTFPSAGHSGLSNSELVADHDLETLGAKRLDHRGGLAVGHQTRTQRSQYHMEVNMVTETTLKEYVLKVINASNGIGTRTTELPTLVIPMIIDAGDGHLLKNEDLL